VRLPAGAVLGRYEVIAHVGGGGMGDVYRARDTHLNKTVALKTIATAYALDPSSQPRFERERRLTAALEHPHICRLLDAGRDAGVDYLAMEYLEGESLAARLTHGPVPVVTAIGYAIEIADALSYAHQRGVVHRDLKPANIFITKMGATVLDFGLAKLRPPSGGQSVVQADTVPLDATSAGTLVGSAPYMAPERLEGQDADHRTDVFGYGVLLYEMLTGRRAFDGNSPAALIAAILSSEPPPLGLPHPKASDLEWIVRRCLAKKPEDRWQSMADVGAVLKRFAADVPEVSRAPRPRRFWLAPAVILLVSLATAAWIASRWTSRHPADQPIAFSVNPPVAGMFTPTGSSLQTSQLALSPDGRSIAFVAVVGGVSRLWIQNFSAVTTAPLPGTEGATFPFWSPDSQSLGFFSDGFLRRIDVAGGRPRQLAQAENGRGGAWNTANDILFSRDTNTPLSRISASIGGTPTEATHLDASRGEASHRWPCFLPDGRRFLFFVRIPSSTHEGIYLGSLDGTPPKLMINTNAGGVFVPPNRILYVNGGTLLARTFNIADGTPTGNIAQIADNVGTSSNFYAAVSASSTGAIAYASIAMTSDLGWMDRRGRRLGTVSTAGQHVDFRLSHDNRLVAIAQVASETDRSDIHVVDLGSNNKRPITSAQATDASPVWSPDARRLVFRSNRASEHDLYWTDSTRSGSESVFQTSESGKYPTSWSTDGKRIAFHVDNGDSGWDVMIVEAVEGSEPQPFLRASSDEFQAQFSRNNQWIAYSSDESGRPEVYVESLARPGNPVQVSENGGTDPRWRGDGLELFYISAKGELTAAALRYRGDSVETTARQPLFTVLDVIRSQPFTSTYDVAADGQRFLVRIPLTDVRTTPLTVLLNRPLQ
jgi:eukaryotic-like serine/threonine-protein kinase